MFRQLRLSPLELLLSLAKIGIASIFMPSAGFAADRMPVPVTLDVGLSEEQRIVWHHLDEGSGFIPLSFFKALTDVRTGKPFLEVLPRFGMIPNPTKPQGLPIGMTIGKITTDSTQTELVGVNCAACHTGKYTYRNQTMLIDGAPNMLNFEALLTDLISSVEHMLAHPLRFVRFLHRIYELEHDPVAKNELFEVDSKSLRELAKVATNGPDHPDFKAHNHVAETLHGMYRASNPSERIEAAHKNLDADEAGKLLDRFGNIFNAFERDLGFFKRRINKLRRLHAAFSNETVAGPGRADSFDAIWDLIVEGGATTPMNAPVSIPHLFNYKSFHFVHWDGNTSTVLARDYAQGIALGADYIKSTGWSSIIPGNVIALEREARSFTSPKWPEAALGPIDRNKAKRGGIVFKSNCLDCHNSEKVYSSTLVGTDPGRARNFSKLTAGGKTYAQILDALGKTVVDASYRENGIDKRDIKDIERATKPEWRNTEGYIARPLAGIWASAPYLHNGSVPTLKDLLEPAARRPINFLVGRELDPMKIGIDAERQPDGGWTFDTTRTGNSNDGHEYGVNLTAREKRDLIEFLKTL